MNMTILLAALVGAFLFVTCIIIADLLPSEKTDENFDYKDEKQ